MATGAHLHCGSRIWTAGEAGHEGMGRWLLCWVSALVATTWWCSALAGRATVARGGGGSPPVLGLLMGRDKLEWGCGLVVVTVP